MPRNAFVSSQEYLILLAVMKLKDNAYGVAIFDEISEGSGKKMVIGTIYAALGSLEKKGFVESYLGEATKERGGRPKQYFKITGEGQSAIFEFEKCVGHLKGGESLAGSGVAYE